MAVQDQLCPVLGDNPPKRASIDEPLQPVAPLRERRVVNQHDTEKTFMAEVIEKVDNGKWSHVKVAGKEGYIYTSLLK